MKEAKVGCGVQQAPPKPEVKAAPLVQEIVKEDVPMIQVGKPAPAFTTKAYHQGKFVEVSLSDFKGKWVYLCFYPGDFTFV